MPLQISQWSEACCSTHGCGRFPPFPVFKRSYWHVTDWERTNIIYKVVESLNMLNSHVQMGKESQQQTNHLILCLNCRASSWEPQKNCKTVHFRDNNQNLLLVNGLFLFTSKSSSKLITIIQLFALEDIFEAGQMLTVVEPAKYYSDKQLFLWLALHQYWSINQNGSFYDSHNTNIQNNKKKKCQLSMNCASV